MNKLNFLSSWLVLTFALSPLWAATTNTVPVVPAPIAKPVSVLLKTNMGDIVVELDAIHAPISTANFLSYVDAKAYDGTIFHRVIPGFCAQGGGYKLDMEQEISEGKTPIKNEATNGLHNLRGTIAMARTNDPNSATSQFFFNLVDNSSQLDPNPESAGYTVFGKITKGLDVMDKIAQVPTTERKGMQDVPATAIILISATRVP